MRSIFTIIKGNLRKGKGSLISVLILMFVLSLTLTAVLTININSSSRDAQALKEAGFGDMIAAVNDVSVLKNNYSVDELSNKLDSADCVESSKRFDCIFCQFKDLNGHYSSSSLMGFRYDPAYYDYKIYKTGANGVYSKRPELKKGEICVPLSFQSLYDCKIGDTLNIITDNGNQLFTVKYFFEDPFMGASMMGIKTILFTGDDLQKLMDEGYNTAIENNGESKVQKGTIFDLKKSASADASSLKYVQDLNNKTGLNNYAWITLTTQQSSSYMLLLVQIFCAVLIGFIVILLVVTIIVLGHNISSSIEQDYVNLGVLKAVGVSQSILRKVLLMQYGLAAFAGIVLGIPASIPFIMVINKLTRPITCLYVSNTIAFLPCIGILLAILVLIELFTLFKTRKVSRIKPIRAIAGCKDDVYFSNRLQLKIRNRGLNILLAIRQLTSNMKQYIGAALISMLLVFFLVMISGMCSWMGTDGSNISRMFNCFDDDIEVYYKDESLRDEIENKIRAKSDIVAQYHCDSVYLNLNDCNLYCFIFDNAEGYNSVLEGRRCEYDNEILVTKFVAKDLGLKIGDKVTITQGDKAAEYIISGYYQSSNDMGSNFSMLQSGYERLIGQEYNKMTNCYALADRDAAKTIVDDLKSTYSREQIFCSASSYDDIVKPIVTATQGITILIYILTIIFVLVIVIMLCSKIFTREKINIGIYKSEGFSTARLRHQFALRFLVVAAVGSLLGVLMVLLLSGFVIQAIFNSVGISDVESSIDLIMYVIPILFMIVLFYVFSYLIAGKIKRVQPRVLISD